MANAGMGVAYETQRVVFAKIQRTYREYLALYQSINNGSLEGATTFDVFYLRMTYYSKYQDRRNFGHSGY
ncbi:MAG: hypothetical protein NTZ90_07175 [Proteobacteria bacterium]|nr:hypothetical protein [Pseudomonadota bacterium]